MLAMHKFATIALITCFLLPTLFTEGRPLRAMNERDAVSTKVESPKETTKQQGTNTMNLHKNTAGRTESSQPTPSASNIHSNVHQFEAEKEDITAPTAPKNDFRPTAPGISPGVGHPIAVEIAIARTASNSKRSATEVKDDFRPTAPGFSPGVGHPKAVGATSLNTEHSTTEEKNSFRPTTPGFSPGVGHPKEILGSTTSDIERSAVATTVDKDDFRPTAPGISPGVGHPKAIFDAKAIENSAPPVKDDFLPTAPGVSPSVGHPEAIGTTSSSDIKHSVTGNTDDFRPTAPGFSPGVGHSKETGTTKNYVTGTTDDFRPTQPSHSPGVGHLFQGKNAEPNA